MKKYSLFNNIGYVYKESCRVNRSMKWWLFLNFLSSLLIPLGGTILTSLVVYILTNGLNLANYIIVLLVMAIVLLLVEVMKIYSFNRYTWENTFVRCNQFWHRLSARSISCDYERIEPKSGQKEVSKAFEALDSNWIGIEGMLKETPVLIVNIIGMLVYFVLVAIYCAWVLIPMVFMVIIDFLLTWRADRLIEKNRKVNNDCYYENAYLSRDIVNPINGKDIRIYRLENWFDRLFIKLTKKRVKTEKSYHLNSLFIMGSHSILDFVRDGIAYVTLIMMVINGTLSPATFTFLIGIVAGFSIWVNGTSETFYRLKGDSTQVCCYRDFLDKNDIFNHGQGLDIKSIEKPIQIEFKNVSFTYPETDCEIIHNLSFIINAGEKVALVGNNGAGKTTIIKLMCGLYEPTSGEILINNHSIKEYNIDEYMSLLSVVFQDSNPLMFTILENVCCEPYQRADRPRFWQAVTEAGLKDKIESLPNKELTYITQAFDQNGIKLSGGETQKLMLARALYKNAPVLVLDEPTSALDPINEEKMYLTYESFAKGNTSIFISHRLASTRFCDRIFYLEQGEIIEVGTHEELINKKGKYASIFDVQAKYYRDGDDNEN